MLQQGVNPKIVQERLGHSSVSTTLDIYSHVLPGLQEAAARHFDESFEHEVHQKNVGKVAQEGGFKVEFISGRGVRAVYGDGLENRCPVLRGRGFESHPLRHPTLS